MEIRNESNPYPAAFPAGRFNNRELASHGIRRPGMLKAVMQYNKVWERTLDNTF
jgi:hypothetical protein